MYPSRPIGSRTRSRRCALVVGVLVGLLAWPTSVALADLPPPPAHGLPTTVRYVAPVPGPVLRGFEPPPTATAAGHRGVDLAASPGAPVAAAAGGRVVFAGAVAETTWVTIVHADGIVTSYGPMDMLRVRAGDRVLVGEVLGVLAASGHGHHGRDRGLHWGARVAGVYIDPLRLLGGVPRPSLVAAGGWRASHHQVRPYEPWPGGRLAGALTSPSPVADRPGFSVAPNPNHLVLVPGLGSSSRSELLDAGHLGYDPESVTRFSYAGRHDGPGAASDPRRDQLPQSPADTWAGTGPAAARLAEQLRAQARREPGRPVDLIGHSMGGVVILRYLIEHHDPYDRTLPQIGHIVTVASPLHGSDLASIGRTVRATPLAGEVVGRLQRGGRLGGDRLPLDARAVEELAVGSRTMWDLAEGWELALERGTAGPLATGTRVLTIGGSTDLTVSAARAQQPDTFAHDGMPADLGLRPGADGVRRLPPGSGRPSGPTADIDGQRVVDHRVLPGGHQQVLRTEAMRQVAWRFLAGEELVASPGHVSRLVGGELADTARLGAELISIHSSVRQVLRAAGRAIPLELDPELVTDLDATSDHRP